MVVAIVPWNGCLTPCLLPDLLDEADRALDRSRRIVLEAEREREEEQHLGVGRALDQGIERGIDCEHEVALDREPVAEDPVVAPEPLLVVERVAVRLLHRRPRRGADVREEEV